MISIKKKVFFFLLLIVLCTSEVYAQGQKKALDFIIVIDENIAIGSISRLNIKAINANKENILEANYYPGNLSLELSDYNKLLSEDVKTIYLDFNYNEYIDGEQHVYHYQIELKKDWLRDYFNILRVYNLNKKKYGRIFFNKEGKEYVYELDSPSHTFHLIRRK